MKHKTYQVPKISERLLKLEGFKYAASIHLNMVYYQTCLSEKTINLHMVILMRKYHYKQAPIGMRNSMYIIQEKLNEQLQYFIFIFA